MLYLCMFIYVTVYVRTYVCTIIYYSIITIDILSFHMMNYSQWKQDKVSYVLHTYIHMYLYTVCIMYYIAIYTTVNCSSDFIFLENQKN